MDGLSERLEALRARGLWRSTRGGAAGAGLVDLTSNDTLGLAGHPALADAARAALEAGVPAGAGASRLLGGTHAQHAALEAEAAAFFGAQAALYFSSGYAAGQALAAALPARGDAIVYDALAHACTRDGIRLSHARAYRAAHNDAQSFDDAARRARGAGARDVWIFVESLYSMDGDAAPLADLAEIARRHEAWLVVDEAHATGVLGPEGQGLTEGLTYGRLIALHTCGKALGCAGGLVTGPRAVIDALVNLARPFIFSTAPPPLQAAVVRRALALIDEEPWRRERVEALRQHAKGALGVPAPSHIIPIILGDEARTLAAAEHLQGQGFAVAAVRPPTVPPGTARLRISLNAGLEAGDLDRLAAALAKI